tara:strand:- start:1356 stop:1643 length:288 start_codon:yes stop_codon:yes gene_type:complete
MSIQSIDDIVEIITSLDPNTKVIKGFDSAILGYDILDTETRVAYSVNHIIRILQKEYDLSFLDAVGHFHSKIQNQHTGLGKPIFIYSNGKNLDYE